MSSSISLASSTKAEWIKFRSLRSSIYSLITLIGLTVGLGALITFAIAKHYADRGGDLTYDPIASSLAGLFFAQFVVGVMGAMLMTGEYATTSIRTSLAAFPRRTEFIISKVVVLVVTLLIVGEAMVFVSYFIGHMIEASYNVPTASLSNGATWRAVSFGGVELVLLSLLGFGLGLLLRRTAAAIAVFVVVLLVAPILLNILPSSWGEPILRWMPSNLSQGMISLTRDAHTFGPWNCLIILALYAIGLVSLGIVFFNRRDA